MATEPLYERDPEAYQEYLAEGNAKQPRKRVVADVLILDEQDRILLVDPNYKPDWDLPGGMVEANEAPHDAARRELREELGLDRGVGSPLVVDWVSPHGVWDDSLAFVFDGGKLTANEVCAISLVGGELDAFEFCDSDLASKRLRPYVWQRVQAALSSAPTTRIAYLVDGVRPH